MSSLSHQANRSLQIRLCGSEICRPGHSYGPAMRDHYLIHCVSDGKGWFQKDNTTWTLRRGQGFLMVPGQVASYAADKEHPWCYRWIGFHGPDAEHVLSLCGIRPEQPVFSLRNIGAVLSCMAELEPLYFDQDNSFAAVGKLYEWFALLQEGTGQMPRRHPDSLERATRYIRQNYSYPLTVEGIARVVGLDRSQLFRIFKKGYGLSPQQYLLRFRLEQAAALMNTTHLSVTEILYSCGFNDPCHFSRQFKEAYGLSPSLYMRSIR